MDCIGCCPPPCVLEQGATHSWWEGEAIVHLVNVDNDGILFRQKGNELEVLVSFDEDTTLDDILSTIDDLVCLDETSDALVPLDSQQLSCGDAQSIVSHLRSKGVVVIPTLMGQQTALKGHSVSHVSVASL